MHKTQLTQDMLNSETKIIQFKKRLDQHQEILQYDYHTDSFFVISVEDSSPSSK